MAAPYHDLYENHFANIRCSRATFLAFLNYTATATAGSPVPALKKLSADLQAAATALGGAVVTREGQGATGQALTRSKKDVLRAMRVFVQDTHAVQLVPAYRQQPGKLKELLPQGLMHLTDANATDLPVRFEAFAQALTAHAADLGAAPGTTAAGLLAELTAASAAKDAGLKVAKETIGSIGGQWAQATQLLWQTHCTALGALWEHPEQAYLYFNYGLLPNRNPGRDKAAKVPAATA
ncbi:hypothetical protein [Hymenobacter armeniacus]|uniref:Uncharacterized protein n=1 Tax=Hymenobacter armeniacus TaxID=2771358 RepID=A0ABR8JWZ6_9BACT|nr:hypothetical protein [Hymenobacter armeniacus]MBD2723077.1 hypothetical protein [Hymenobacter armeniacus]